LCVCVCNNRTRKQNSVKQASSFSQGNGERREVNHENILISGTCVCVDSGMNGIKMHAEFSLFLSFSPLALRCRFLCIMKERKKNILALHESRSNRAHSGVKCEGEIKNRKFSIDYLYRCVFESKGFKMPLNIRRCGKYSHDKLLPKKFLNKIDNKITSSIT
jgi:hypothetical protein